MKKQMLSEKTKSVRISKEEYNEIFKGIDLKEILLIQSNSSFQFSEKSFDKDARDMDVEPKEVLKVAIDGNTLIGTHGLTLIGRLGANKKRRNVFEVSCTFACVFISKQKLTKKFADEFERRNLRLFTVPFIREFIQNLTMRMCISPLVLPMYKQ